MTTLELARITEPITRVELAQEVLKDWRTCDPDDPAMDCGGDCAACQYEYDEGAPPEIRGPKPREAAP